MSGNQRQKKILFLSYAAYPLFNPKVPGVHGGAELDLFNIATHLDKKKFEIHFIVGDYGQSPHEIINGIFIHSAQKVRDASFISGVKNFFHLFLIVKRINPDVLITKALGWLTIELIIIKVILRKKMIFRSSHRRNIDGFVDSKPYGKLFRRLINQIDYFLVQNKEDRRILLETYNFKNPIFYIPNLHPIERKDPMPISQRKTILWVGRCESVKNPTAFLDLAKSNPSLTFLMILPNTDPILHEKVLLRAKSIPNISIIGKVPHREILQYFSKAKYLVITSLGEGFPNVLIESFSQGTPVISMNVDFDDILSKGNIGYLGNGSIKSLSAFINSTSDSSWNTLSNNAYSFSVKHFDITNRIQSYEKILIQI